MASPALVSRAYAEGLLRQAAGVADIAFRDGQWEAIDCLVNRHRRALVVQRTGWGKSMVYFLSAKILRDQGAGPALIVSPLLALMRNQIDASQRLGLLPATINSGNREDWQRVRDALLANQIDLLLISPERLANDEFVAETLLPIAGKIGLLVVDEAHCISDHQCRNLDGAFAVNAAGAPFAEPVLLVDDVIDSGWTLAVIATLLRRAGSGPVFPLALANAGVD